jgi:hypothetical protein
MEGQNMYPRILVVARGKAAFNKFEQSSLQRALNLKDFLEETGEYEEVSIFQLSSIQGPLKEWVKLDELEA